jgi:hypothetical protein
VHILKYSFFVGFALLGLLFLVAASIDPPRENQLLQSSASLAALRSIANHGERRAVARVPFPRLQSERVAANPDVRPEEKPAVNAAAAQPRTMMNAHAELPAKKTQTRATTKTSKRKFRKLRQSTRIVENVQSPVGYRAW